METVEELSDDFLLCIASEYKSYIANSSIIISFFIIMNIGENKNINFHNES